MTDRIEAIRARHAAHLEPKPDDVAFLLASVDRVTLILDNVERQLGELRSTAHILAAQRDDAQVALAALAPVAPDAEPDVEQVDHAAEHYATTGSDHCWCAE